MPSGQGPAPLVLRCRDQTPWVEPRGRQRLRPGPPVVAVSRRVDARLTGTRHFTGRCHARDDDQGVLGAASGQTQMSPATVESAWS